MQAFGNVILKGGKSNSGGGCVSARNYGILLGTSPTFNIAFDGTSFQSCTATGTGPGQGGGALALTDNVKATFKNMRYSGNTPDDIKTATLSGSSAYPTITCTSAPASCSDVVTKDTADKCEALDFPAITAWDAIKDAVEADDNCKSCTGTTSNCKASCSDKNGVTASATAVDSTDCGPYPVKAGAGRCACHSDGS